MKKKMAVLMAAMMLLSLAACGKGEKEQISVESGKLIMATEAAFAPYEYKSNGEIVGVDVEIAQAIADELGLELVLSALSLRNVRLRRLLCGKPVILIENGNILQQNLRKTRITLD